jgi:glycosyltransferase involved in cell wall biosynthesis
MHKNQSEFKVSVITPVYNAENFITRSVESALSQPETGEVLLVEDNSPDNSLDICTQLARKYEKVKLLQHPDGHNHGAGASRNLGMKNTSFAYLGFVDADNFYLENRFLKTKEVFKMHPDCEGVYEAIGIHVENEAAMARWMESNRQSPDKLITLSKPVEPKHLAKLLLAGGYGSLTLDGFVIKKDVMKKVGYMDEHLRLHQDTEWIIRCAIAAKLYPGNLKEAVAMEGVHESNRFSAPRSQSQEYRNRMKYMLSLYHWGKINAPQDIRVEILNKILRYTKAHKYFLNFPRDLIPVDLIKFARLFRLLRYPEIILDSLNKI